MRTQALARIAERMPLVFEDFFKPWNEWFDGGNLMGRSLVMPAVNITEYPESYQLELAAPGLKKDDFKIGIEGNMLTISSEKEETKEEKERNFTRKEYNYSSFNRSFSLPEEIKTENIDAKYEDGILKILLPRKEEAKQALTKQIEVK